MDNKAAGGETALEMAKRLHGDDSEIVKILEAISNANAGETAVDYARRTGNLDALLVMAKADPDVAMTAIEVGLTSSDPATVQKTYDFMKGNILRTAPGPTAAQIAGSKGDIETIKTLAKKDPNAVMEAVIAGLRGSDPAVVKKIYGFMAENVEKSADVNATAQGPSAKTSARRPPAGISP